MTSPGTKGDFLVPGKVSTRDKSRLHQLFISTAPCSLSSISFFLPQDLSTAGHGSWASSDPLPPLAFAGAAASASGAGETPPPMAGAGGCPASSAWPRRGSAWLRRGRIWPAPAGGAARLGRRGRRDASAHDRRGRVPCELGASLARPRLGLAPTWPDLAGSGGKRGQAPRARAQARPAAS